MQQGTPAGSGVPEEVQGPKEPVAPVRDPSRRSYQEVWSVTPIEGAIPDLYMAPNASRVAAYTVEEAVIYGRDGDVEGR